MQTVLLSNMPSATTPLAADRGVPSLRRTAGFTMLELLIVMAIIGILAAITLNLYGRWTRNETVRNAATQLYTDFNQVRTAAQRNSQDAKLEFTSAQSYKLTLPGNQVVLRQLPSQSVARVYSSGNDPTGQVVTYAAPYAKLPSSAAFEVASTLGNQYKRIRVGLAGVTGTVVMSDLN